MMVFYDHAASVSGLYVHACLIFDLNLASISDCEYSRIYPCVGYATQISFASDRPGPGGNISTIVADHLTQGR